MVVGEARGELRQLDDSADALFGSLMYLVSPQLRQLAAEAGETRNPFEVAEERYVGIDRLLREILDDLHGSTDESSL